MKKPFLTVCALLLVLSLSGCAVPIYPIEDCVWQLENAFDEAGAKDGSFLAWDESRKQEANPLVKQYLTCLLSAGDGSLSIEDKTNGQRWSGSYRVQSREPETTVYAIRLGQTEGTAVTGVVTYADGSQRRTLILTLEGKCLTFYEKT